MSTPIEFLQRASTELRRKPLDVIYGPYAADLRAELASMIHGRKLAKSDKLCQYGRLRAALVELVGATGNCIAAVDEACNDAIMRPALVLVAPAVGRKPLVVSAPIATRQGKLFAGADCLPGQLDLVPSDGPRVIEHDDYAAGQCQRRPLG